MSSQAGSPPAAAGETSLAGPSQPKKRGRKEGGATKAKGKGKAKDADADDQQQRRQSQAPLSAGGNGESSLNRSQTASGAQAGNADERPAKAQKVEKRGQQKMSRKNLFAKERESSTRYTTATFIRSIAEYTVLILSVPSLMYAFGDDRDPLPESVNVLEEILVDYLSDLVSH